MASIMTTIPDGVKADMKRFPWVNWSEVAREELLRKLERLKAAEEFERIIGKSRLTKKDALAIGRDIKRSVWKRHKGMS